MKTAKVFTNGSSQAIRLPKEFRFNSDEVFVKKFDNIVMLFSKDDPWATLIDSLNKFTPDFLISRKQPKTQARSGLA